MNLGIGGIIFVESVPGGECSVIGKTVMNGYGASEGGEAMKKPRAKQKRVMYRWLPGKWYQTDEHTLLGNLQTKLEPYTFIEVEKPVRVKVTVEEI